MSNTRPSALAGHWYPAQAEQLSRTVDNFIEQATLPPVSGQLMGVLAPHAGHRYSGAVAGHAFRAMQGLTVDTVAVIGPMHHAMSGALLTTAHDAYWTPLGEILIDQVGLQAVQAACEVPITPIYGDPEHSVEIELPFLQRVFSSFELLPIMMRDDSASTCAALGRALATALQGRRSLLVASSDLSHFYPQREANRLDAYMLEQIETFDPEAVLQAEAEGKGFACGHAPIAAVLTAARLLGGQTVKVVNHATSGDVSGDYHSVVGYGAALILN